MKWQQKGPYITHYEELYFLLLSSSSIRGFWYGKQILFLLSSSRPGNKINEPVPPPHKRAAPAAALGEEGKDVYGKMTEMTLNEMNIGSWHNSGKSCRILSRLLQGNWIAPPFYSFPLLILHLYARFPSGKRESTKVCTQQEVVLYIFQGVLGKEQRPK